MANIWAGVHSHLSVASGSSQVDGRDRRSSGMYLRFEFCPWTSGPSTTIRFSCTGLSLRRRMMAPVFRGICSCMGRRRRHSQATPNACEPSCSYWVGITTVYPYPSRGFQSALGVIIILPTMWREVLPWTSSS